MTVETLIKRLSKCSEDMVVLETESDSDMKDEIYTRFELAKPTAQVMED